MRAAREPLDRAIDSLRKQGWSVELLETSRVGQARALARQAVEQHLNAVIAVGGDGTMNEVANGVVDSETAMGVLPLGTANVWAKEMGLPLGDLQVAARLLARGELRAIDVGMVRGPSLDPRIFVLWCGVGLDAAITRDIEPQRELKRRWGAIMFWVVGTRDAWSYRGKRATIKLDERRLRKRIILALVSNAQLYGGIVRIDPSARLDDGLLNMTLFKGTGFGATALHLVRVILGLHLRDPQVEIYPTACVSIEGKNLPVQVDGEPIGFAPVEIRVVRRALKVLVPETANPSLFGKD